MSRLFYCLFLVIIINRLMSFIDTLPIKLKNFFKLNLTLDAQVLFTRLPCSIYVTCYETNDTYCL